MATSEPFADAVPPGLGKSGPGYEQRLGCIGRFLDDEDLQSIAIVEVEEGVLVRATRHGNRSPELFEFPDAEPAVWIAAQAPRRGLKRLRRDDDLFGHGYTAALTTLGKVLDLRGASAVTITEGGHYLIVGGIFPATTENGALACEQVADLLLVEDIRMLEAGALPAALDRPDESRDAIAQGSSVRSVARSITGAVAGAGGALGSAVARFGRRAHHGPRQAAADIPD